MLPVLYRNRKKICHMSWSSFQDAFQINCSAVVGYQAVYRQDIQYIFSYLSVLRIWDVYPVSEFFPYRIPDPNSFHPGSRIRIKEFEYLTPKMVTKLSGCSSRIRILVPDTDLPIPDPRTRIKKGTGSRNTAISYFLLVKCREHYCCCCCQAVPDCDPLLLTHGRHHDQRQVIQWSQVNFFYNIPHSEMFAQGKILIEMFLPK